MRERTTWNHEKIAATAKRAEDPRAMNQDHLQQQPGHDKYLTGGPSEFAEDVHPSGGTWKAEQSGGETKRNEIGMPEMRGDTFNHPEKTAALDEETVLKKAHITCKIARAMLGNDASDDAVEKQAHDLMFLPDEQIIATYNRLAGVVVAEDQDDEDEDEGDDDQGQGQQGQGQQGQGQQQKQAKKGEQDQQAQDQQAGKKGEQDQQAQDQQKEAGKKGEQDQQAQDQDKEGEQEQQAQDQQQKQAMTLAGLQSALASGDAGQVQAAIQGMVQAMLPGVHYKRKKGEQDQMGYSLGQGMQDQMGMQQQMSAEQVQAMIQSAIEGMQQQMGQQDQMGMQDQMGQIPPGIAQQQQMSDDQMLDQMLQDQGQQMWASGEAPADVTANEIQLEGVNMDIGASDLDENDTVLAALFNDNPEVQNATHAAALQGHPVPAAPAPGHGARTASTATVASRPVGTNPTQGVSTIGGGSPAAPGTNEVQKLSGLWASAPDVSNVFG